MIRLAEQSNVPFVVTLKTVGMPAFATTLRGEYPPFALISIICLPSTTETDGDIVLLVSSPGLADVNQNATAIKIALSEREMTTRVFINVRS